MRIFAVCAALVMLSGCTPVTIADTEYIRSNSQTGADALVETTLQSGTRCVVLKGLNYAALACDWPER